MLHLKYFIFKKFKSEMLLDYSSNSTLVFLSKVTFNNHFILNFSCDLNCLKTGNENVWSPKFRWFFNLECQTDKYPLLPVYN